MDQVAESVEKMDILQETAPTKDQILAEGAEKRDILPRTVPMKPWQEVRGNKYNIPSGLFVFCGRLTAFVKMYIFQVNLKQNFILSKPFDLDLFVRSAFAQCSYNFTAV